MLLGVGGVPVKRECHGSKNGVSMEKDGGHDAIHRGIVLFGFSHSVFERD